MKGNHIIRTIWNINGILILIGLCVILVAGAVSLIEHFTPPSPSQSVKVITEKESKTVPIEYEIYDNITILKDYYIFSIQSNVVRQGKNSLRLNASRDDSVSYAMAPNDSESYCNINLIFVSSLTKTKKVLFDQNGLILHAEFAVFDKTRDDQSVFPKNLYEVVFKDTNKNGQLDENDNRDLYISEYNGENLQLLKKNIYSCEILNDNQVLIVKNEDGKKVFEVYDLKTEKITKILDSLDLKL